MMEMLSFGFMCVAGLCLLLAAVMKFRSRPKTTIAVALFLVAAVIILIRWLAAWEYKDCYPEYVRFPENQKSVVIPLEKGEQFLFVKGKINGTDAGYFLLDTGSYINSVSSETATDFRLPADGFVHVVSRSGEEKLIGRRINRLSIGEVEFGPHRLGEEAWTIQTRPDVKIAGYLGAPFFKQLPFTIDYGRSTLTLYNPKTFMPPPSHRYDFKWRSRIPRDDYSPACLGRMNGRYEDWFVLDTGSTYTFLPHSFVNSIPGLTSARKTDSVQTNQTTFTSYILPSFELLGRRHTNFEAKSVTVIDRFRPYWKSGTAGADILSHFRLTFDYRCRSVWVEESPEPSVDVLVQKGVELNGQDLFGYTPLFLAARDNKVERVRALLQAGADPNIRINDKATPLSIASWQGHAEVVETLLKHRADPNLKGPKGNTALIWAASAGHPQIIELLLQHGADPNFQAPDGTALIYASSAGDTDVVRLFLEHGANPNTKTPYGNTALIVASKKGHVSVIDALLKHGADVNLSSLDLGATALTWASYEGHPDVVGLLIEHGADIHHRNKEGKNALMLAKERGHTEVVKILEQAGAKE